MPQVIKVDRISKTLGKKKMLNNISFSVDRGELIGLIGPNGAGKTTLIRALLGLIRPDEGGINMFQYDRLADSASEHINQRIGFVLDKSGFSEEMSALDNIINYSRLYRVHSRDSKARILELASLFKMEDRLKDKVGAFSKGMLQKLCIIRSLVHMPELLVLDEVTSGLDPMMQIEIRNLLVQLTKERGITILMSSHQLDEVERICNKVLLMDQGTLKLSGSMDQVLKAQTMIVSFTLTEDNEDIQSAIEEIETSVPGVVSTSRDLSTLIFELSEFDALFMIQRKLIERNIRFTSMNAQDNKLEDVYMSFYKVEEGE
ncbi:ABC-2 type transport system ATP-binding protein [Paenibacillus forsythiae]|uniref:ABC-2 type transport system ATP-binding protein n=1 Tax=Paenibacillus forsythiae TaxID=365616 RepID=A0ABU3H6K3_9BACL|nr:ABC transporter ATP-binding protein [Paenibacillus forsythiae]MDT3426462.1 ABC-2 type transport system ATP-binding protein [Paenibacillus forsythiae]